MESPMIYLHTLLGLVGYQIKILHLSKIIQVTVVCPKHSTTHAVSSEGFQVLQIHRCSQYERSLQVSIPIGDPDFLEKSFRWFLQNFFWDPLDLFRAYISIRPSHIHTVLNINLTCLTSLPRLKLFYKYNNICKSNISFESKSRITNYQPSNLYLDWTLVIGARWGLDPFADKNSEF